MSRPYRPGRAGSHQTFPSGSLSRGRSLLGQITTLGLAEVGADGEVDIVEPGTPLAELYGLSMKAIGPAAVEAGALTPEQAAALVERPNQPDFLACGSFTSASGGVVRRSRSARNAIHTANRRATPCSVFDMNDEERTDAKRDHEPPRGAAATGSWNDVAYTSTAKWLVLRKKEKPSAEIFSVAYVAESTDLLRPVTFVFNGGPGASSAYLHVGAVGPQRVAFPVDGTLPPMPPRLVHNEESWLAFTDLVFVDPVGTGFSRIIEKDAQKKDDEKKKGEGEQKGGEPDPNEYFGYKRDLESLSEFIGRWLSGNRRWGSPVFIAGESYGGYRVGRLVRSLQEAAGIGLNGAILISPALEIGTLASGDYDVLAWVDLLPTMAGAAAHHGRSRAFGDGTPLDDVRREAEAFATSDYTAFLTRGASMPADERHGVVSRLADLIGLPVELVDRAEGRVPINVFARELLRDERKVVGLYDATITVTDPFPDREPFGGPDPTLSGISPAYTMAINRQVRSEIGVETDREYALLSYEVNQEWKDDDKRHFFVPPAGATDDFRYGMALNPHLKAFIAHGQFDLVTPYYASDRLRNLMRLDPSVAGRVTVRHFGGGHMFYAWEESRRAFTAAIAEFFADATAAAP